ncbi:N-6 DNA methylase [Pseudonocardia sp.]|uniref:N-6 DNA methylase n=1 Tax=Pseudonocardia sp. TaxID=60912 RepID=UPI003D134A63
MDEWAVVTAADVARLAGVGRAAVSNWRRRYDDFPRPVGGSESSPTFPLVEVRSWLRARGRLGAHSLVELAWQALEMSETDGSMAEAVAAAGSYLASGDVELDAGVRNAIDELADEAGNTTAFEQLCARYVEASSRQLAATPPELASLMIELARLDAGPVLDPACGTGSLLLAAPRGLEVLGQELDVGLAALARSRLAFTHPAARVETGNALRADGFAGVHAAAVVCNPPFNERAWGYEELQLDPRWTYGLPPKGESELAWVQHCLAHVRPGGRVVIVLPPGVASRRSGRPIRAALLRRGVVRAVISLPPGAVAPAHLPMQLWVMAVDGADADHGVRLVDTCAGAQVKLDEIGWPEVGRRVHRAIADEEDPATHRLVPTIDLLDDDVDLTPGRYLRPGPGLDSIGNDRRRLLELLGRLGDSLPQLTPSTEHPRRPSTTVGELVRLGVLTIHQQVGALELGPGPGTPVLVTADVLAGHGPTGSVIGDVDGVRLQPGDVIIPTVMSRPSVFVVEADTEALLGPGLQLLRPDPRQLDPWFLAGVLRSGETTRVAATKTGTHRVDVRRVELPRLPVAEQYRVGEQLRMLDHFGVALDEAAGLGQRLVQALTDAVVRGELEPGGGT